MKLITLGLMRRFWNALVLLFLAGPGSIAGAAAAPDGHAAPPDKPNFIVILADDLDSRSVEFMPKLKALVAKQGTTFANSFVTTSLCCPSRASLLRGQYAHNHQVLTNTMPEGGFQKFYALGHEQSTLATWLKAAGYKTVMLGKYLNQYPGKQKRSHMPPGWDEWYAVSGLKERYFNASLNENGRLVSYGHEAKDYLTDLLAAKTVDFISRNGPGKPPFFIYLAPTAPHFPATPAPRHEKEFSNAAAPRTRSFNERDVSGKPSWLQQNLPLSSDAIAKMDQLYRKRLQSMLAVDEMIEAIMAALEAQRALRSTYIIFTSDNGFHLGQHRLQFKSTPYEEDIRVPLIVRGPGVPAGRTLRHFILNIDLAPTLAELAGASVPSFVDGRSFKQLLGDKPPPVHTRRQDFAVEYWPAGPQESRSSPPRYTALRSKDYLYVEYATGDGDKELYDLRADPDQLKNLWRSARSDLISQLQKRLGVLARCAGQSCR
jgi:N-acetylglucosamine-6-sulfatase